jgi:phosphate transport system substrate-binding protein
MEGLVQKWAVNYMAANTATQVLVKDGDTGSGISDLISGKIDVAAASREVTDAERELAKQKGVRFKREMVAKDAIAIIVNPTNKVDSIVVSDLAKIYGGQIVNWKQIDSKQPEEPIRAFGRETSSGTADYFQQHVLQGKQFDPGVKVMPSSEALMGAVMGNRLAIGFVGMAQATAETSKVKVLKLKLTATSPAIEKNALLAGHDYPLSRPLYVYYNSANDGKVTKFVQYCLSADGQKTVSEMGFLPAR